MFKKPTKIYRPIFKKAWEITKQNRFLWVFGLFAALAGNGGVYEILVKGFGRIVSEGEATLVTSKWLWLTDFLSFPRLEDIYVRSPIFVSLLWVLFFVILVALAFLIWVVVTSRGALIASIKKIASKKKTGMREGWTEGKKYFWPVLGLNLLAKALTFGLLVLITVPAMIFLASGGVNVGLNLFLYILAFVVFTSLALFVSFMAVYATCFVVMEGKSFVESIRLSWKMFIKNWLLSIEMALMLFAITIGAGIAIILFTLLYMIPVALLLFAFSYLELTIGFWLITFLATLGWFIALFFVGAILSTFQFSSWSLLFIEINKKKIWSKLLRFVGIGR
ncbi:hypothetical protein KKD80_02720 [Patescibacteria group bacterium]|nr:hypothetical protein [Patescibacteria group bacterium]